MSSEETAEITATTTATAAATTVSSVNEQKSRELTETEQKYFEVLKDEHQKWKKMYDQYRKPNEHLSRDLKADVVHSKIDAKQKEVFENDLDEIDKYYSQIDDLDTDIAKATTKVEQLKQVWCSLHDTIVTNVYKDIDIKISNYD